MGTRKPAERIVEFLSLSPEANRANLGDIHPRKWKGVLRWMDDAGLSFYFLNKLKQTGATDTVPDWIASRLKTNLAANSERVGYLADRFDLLNRRFNAAGVRYAVLKGFSLIPEFCPDPNLRHQADLDYLVDEESLPAAQRIVVEAGYKQKPDPSNQEFVFIRPGMGNPSRRSEQYSACSPHAVELHLDIWESNLPAVENLFSSGRAEIYGWQGLSFPALIDDDAFLLQVLHTSQHLFRYWVRMSCLFEIAYFLNRRHCDIPLWSRVEQRVGENLVLRDFVVVVTELAMKLFASPIPLLIREWGAKIRCGTRVWIDNYARDSAFCDLPTHRFTLLPREKLILFLHQQYRAESGPRHLVRSRILPSSRLRRMVSSVQAEPWVALDRRWWKHHRPLRRSFFHVMAGLRYLFEIPRWRWMNRRRAQSVSLHP